MTPATIRPFARSDRDQLAALVNAHIGAVTPGASVSVQALLSHLEREPGEFIVDRWVRERATLVAEQRGRVVAAAHLLRYGSGPSVNDSYRSTAEIRWLVCWPAAPFWPDSPAAGTLLAQACVAQFDAWQVGRSFADGSLPAPGVYGVPEQWPLVASLYAGAGYGGGRLETVLIASTDVLVARLPNAAARCTNPTLRCLRSLGINGTRFSAVDGDTVLGYIEVDTSLGEAARFSRGSGWADVGNLYVDESRRRRGIGTWLLAQATHWLELGGIGRLLAYLGDEDSEAEAAFLAAVGFQHLSTMRRGLERAHLS